MEKTVALAIEALEPEEATRLVCALALGLLRAVQDEAIDLEEAERLLFSPRTAHTLQHKGLGPELPQLILECCELEDVLSLIPERFAHNVEAMAERFSSLLKGDAGYEERTRKKAGRVELYVIR